MTEIMQTGCDARLNEKSMKMEKTIIIYDQEITEQTATRVLPQIRNATAEDVLKINVSTFGGEVNSASKIYAAIINSPAKTIAYADGLVASAGSFIVLAADVVVANDMTQFMIHNSWAPDENGMPSGIKDDYGNNIDNAILNTLVSRSAGKLSEKQIREMLKAETFMTGKQMKEYGWADVYQPADAETRQRVAKLEVPAKYAAMYETPELRAQYRAESQKRVDKLFTTNKIAKHEEKNTMTQQINRAKELAEKLTVLNGGNGFLNGATAMAMISPISIENDPFKDVTSDKIQRYTLDETSLLPHVTVTNIPGLSEVDTLYTPMTPTDLENDDATAKEIELKGDKSNYDYTKRVKEYFAVSDTLFHGSDEQLVLELQNMLKERFNNKLESTYFNENAEGFEKHQSVYDEENNVKRISGKKFYTTIHAALADLAKPFRKNAKVYMNTADFNAMELEDIHVYEDTSRFFNAELVVSDSIASPIVGDLSTIRTNISNTNIDTFINHIGAGGIPSVPDGSYVAMYSAWYDTHVLLASALRIVDVK